MSNPSSPIPAGYAAAPRRLAIVEDHELLAHSLAQALDRQGLPVAVVLATDEQAVLDRLAELWPDIVLLDLELGAVIGSALTLIPSIRELGADVIMMTGVTDRIRLAECVEAGAVGYVSKTESFDQLLERVADVGEGKATLGIAEREALLDELRQHREREGARLEPFRRLTVREGEVLQDLVDGLNAEAIAEQAFLSKATVRSHIKAILQKLGVNSQLAAVAMATHAGWTAEHRRPAR